MVSARSLGPEAKDLYLHGCESDYEADQVIELYVMLVVLWISKARDRHIVESICNQCDRVGIEAR